MRPCMPHDEPAGGNREPLRVQCAQVVRVRVPARTERAECRHLIAVVEGERGDRLARAGHLGAEPFVGAE